MFDILRPFLFKINPETAHSLAINALKFGNIASIKINKSPRIETSIFNEKIYLFLMLELLMNVRLQD